MEATRERVPTAPVVEGPGTALARALGCPSCHAGVVASGDDEVRCEGCSATYPVLEGVPMLMRPEIRVHLSSLHQDWEAGAIRPPISYRTLTKIASPALHRPRSEPATCRSLLDGLPDDAVVVDIGSGLADYDDRIYRLDIQADTGVDVGADAHDLPFRDGSVDGIFIHRVLEHVPDPPRVVAEIARVLKPGGFISAIVPFIEPYHRNPVDHSRYNRDGLRHLLRAFDEQDLSLSAGPTAGFLWILKEWAAIACPGSNHPFIYASVRELTGWLTYPLVWIDRWVSKKRYAHKIACEFWFVGRIPDREGTGASAEPAVDR